MIEHLIINALWIWGFHTLFQPGMILFKLSNKLTLMIPPRFEWIHKPLWLCPPCMSSIHGFCGFFLAGHDITLIPAYLIALTGLNYLLTQLR